MPGRPPVDPMSKASIAIRCLVSPVVATVVDKGMRRHANLLMSDYLRLALYNQLRKDGLLDELTKAGKMEDDQTWKELMNRGLV